MLLWSAEQVELGVYPISGSTGRGMGALLDAVIEFLPAATGTERPAGELEEGDDKEWSPI